MDYLINLRDWLAQSFHYLLRLGLWEGIRFSWADIRKIRELRYVSISGYQIWLRTASSDFRVAEGILAGKEYHSVKEVVLHPDIILDVGANIGASAIYFAQAYPHATIYAFEPEADNYRVLEKNCQSWNNIIPQHAAIWSQSMTREILNRKTGAWGYTVADVKDGVTQFGQSIPCTSMTDFITRIGIEKIDMLKMDIEGGEKEILEHADDWIDQVEVLALELHDRICPGCTEAFHQATRSFQLIKSEGEKVIAVRNPVA